MENLCPNRGCHTGSHRFHRWLKIAMAHGKQETSSQLWGQGQGVGHGNMELVGRVEPTWGGKQAGNRHSAPTKRPGLDSMIGECHCLKSQQSHGPAHCCLCVEPSWWQHEFWEQSFQALGCVTRTKGTEIATLCMCAWGLAPFTLKRALSFIKEDFSKAQIRWQLTISKVTGDPPMHNTIGYSVLSWVTFPSGKA